jgi:hypothetical protein
MVYFKERQSVFSTPFTALAPTYVAIPSGYTGTVWDTTVKNTLPGATKSLVYRSETVLTTGTLFAPPLVVLWQSSDLSLFPNAYATALAATVGVSIGTQSPDSETSSHTSSLSTGTKAGISVGAMIGIAFVAGLIVYFCLRQRKKARHSDIPELSGQSSGFKTMFHGKFRAEMEGTSKPTEVDSRNVVVIPGSPVELEAR